MSNGNTSKLAWQSDEHRFVSAPEFPPRVRLLKWVGRQNWIPRGHDRLLRAIWNPDTGKHFNFDVDFFGIRYRGDLAHYIDWLVFTYGAAPLSELTLLEEVTKEFRADRKTVHFFDIGANVGHHTLFMSRIADLVYAFEPFPPSRAVLENRVALNNLNNVRIIPVGLGDQDAEISYYARTDRNSGAGTFIENRGEGYAEAITLPVRQGDTLFDQLQLARLDVLKVDVEGFESLVLRGLKEHIRRDRPAILTEWTENSRKRVPDEKAFRELFYDEAVIAEVGGRLGKPFELKPFSYARAAEVLILPPERAALIRDRL